MKQPHDHNNPPPPPWEEDAPHAAKKSLLKKPPQQESDRKPPAVIVRSANDSQTEQSYCSTNDASHSTAVAYYNNNSSSGTASAPKKGGTEGEATAVALPSVHMATIEEGNTGRNQRTSPSLSQMTGTAIFLAGTSVASTLTFIVMILPTEALMALGVAIITTILLLIQLYRCTLQAYADAVNGRGIGDYLPSWLFSALVEESIHQRMVDPTFELEWRHLALYFFPGLSRAQLESYIDRLPYRHRQFLLRPGLGHVMGNEFMQLILGRERYPEVPGTTAQHAVVPPSVILEEPEAAAATVVLPPPPSSAVPVSSTLLLPSTGTTAATTTTAAVDNHVDVDGSESIWSDHDAPVLARELAGARPPRHVVATTTRRDVTAAAAADSNTAPVVPSEENNLVDYDFEFDILFEAFTVGMTSMVITPVLSATRYMTNSVSTFLTRPSVALTLVGGTMGVFGYSRGLWGRQGLRTNLTLRDRDVWTTAVLGGGMASVLLFVRSCRTTTRNSGTDRRHSLGSKK